MKPSRTAASNGGICDHDLPTQLALITDIWIPHNPKKIIKPEWSIDRAYVTLQHFNVKLQCYI